MTYPRPTRPPGPTPPFTPFTRLDIPIGPVRRPVPVVFDAPCGGCGNVIAWTSQVVNEQGSGETRPDATHDCEEAA